MASGKLAIEGLMEELEKTECENREVNTISNSTLSTYQNSNGMIQTRVFAFECSPASTKVFGDWKNIRLVVLGENYFENRLVNNDFFKQLSKNSDAMKKKRKLIVKRPYAS